MNPCTEGRRFDNIESDITELKDQVKLNSTNIIELKESHAETRVYVKQIFERIEDIKALFKTGTQAGNETWSKVVIELIKMIGIVGGIIAGIKLM